MDTGLSSWTLDYLHGHWIIFMDIGLSSWRLDYLHGHWIIFMDIGLSSWTLDYLHGHWIIFIDMSPPKMENSPVNIRSLREREKLGPSTKKEREVWSQWEQKELILSIHHTQVSRQQSMRGKKRCWLNAVDTTVTQSSSAVSTPLRWIFKNVP